MKRLTVIFCAVAAVTCGTPMSAPEMDDPETQDGHRGPGRPHGGSSVHD